MATTTAPPPTARLDHLELRRFLNALRFQLWWRDALVLVAVSALVGALLGAALIGAWVAAVFLVIGLVIAGVRRPTPHLCQATLIRRLRATIRPGLPAHRPWRISSRRRRNRRRPRRRSRNWRMHCGRLPRHATSATRCAQATTTMPWPSSTVSRR